MEATRRLIREMMGVYTPATKLAKELSIETMQRIFNEVENIKEFPYVYAFNFNYTKKHLFLEKNNIININIEPIIYKDKVENKEINEVGGSIEHSKTKQHNIDGKLYYEVSLNVKVYNWDLQTDLTKKIESVLSHELLHAHVEVSRFGKRSYTKTLMKTRNRMKNLFFDENNNYPELKRFLDVFYLSVPDEMNARVHQLYTDIEEHKDKDYNEIVLELNKYSVFRDLKRMEEYNSGHIYKEVPIEKQKEFIDYFLASLQGNWKGKDIKYPTEPAEFFKFWEQQFRNNASKFRMKILKMIKNIKQIKEEDVYNLLSEEVISEIFLKEDCYLL